jgi:hypothetical protein
VCTIAPLKGQYSGNKCCAVNITEEADLLEVLGGRKTLLLTRLKTCTLWSTQKFLRCSSCFVIGISCQYVNQGNNKCNSGVHTAVVSKTIVAVM